jgi:hypothetical protein
MDRNHRTTMQVIAVYLQILHCLHYQRWHLSHLDLGSLPNIMPIMECSPRRLQAISLHTQPTILARTLVP